jgi:amino acid permease
LGGTATIPNEVLNLVKNIVGAGALALPSGVAAFASAPSALYAASLWLLIMGAMFAYYFLLLGRVCRITKTATYAEAWERLFGPQAWVALAVALKAGMGNLECSMILADSFRDLLHTLGWKVVNRTGALWLVTLVALLPLCLLKNLAVLAPFSMLGLLAMAFTGVAIAMRYFDGSYVEGGQFYNEIDDKMKPSFGDQGFLAGFGLNVLVLLCMVSEAYIAHYNAPRFWIELKQRSVPRFGKVVCWSFGISAAYYVFVTSFGFLTFGAHSAGFLLNNYSTQDTLASISRACVGCSLIFGYPLIFVGFRDAMLDVFLIPPSLQTAYNLNLLTILMLTLITLLAMVLQDLGLVTAVGGGTLGTVVVFIVPTLMFDKTVKLMGTKAASGLKQEVYFVTVLMWIGIAIGVTGVWIALTR